MHLATRTINSFTGGVEWSHSLMLMVHAVTGHRFFISSDIFRFVFPFVLMDFFEQRQLINDDDLHDSSQENYSANCDENYDKVEKRLKYQYIWQTKTTTQRWLIRPIVMVVVQDHLLLMEKLYFFPRPNRIFIVGNGLNVTQLSNLNALWIYCQFKSLNLSQMETSVVVQDVQAFNLALRIHSMATMKVSFE